MKKENLEIQDYSEIKLLVLNKNNLENEFCKINWSKLNLHCRKRIIFAKIIQILSTYQYSTLKPFEGIKSLAVLEILQKENNIIFPGISKIKKIFFEMEMKMGFVKTDELLIQLMNDEEVYSFMCEKIRKPVKNLDSDFEFFDENLNELLQRIEIESEKYIDWDEFKQYFSYRGKN